MAESGGNFQRKSAWHSQKATWKVWVGVYVEMAGIMEVRYVKNDIYIDEETVYFFKFQQDNRVIPKDYWCRVNRCLDNTSYWNCQPIIIITWLYSFNNGRICRGQGRFQWLKVVETFKEKVPGILNKLHERFEMALMWRWLVLWRLDMGRMTYILYISSSSSKTIEGLWNVWDAF